MDDLMQPPLPEPNIIYDDHSCDDLEYYTADQLRDYAKKAVEAERANRPYWLCCGGIDPQVHRRGCIEAQSGHPERCVFGTASEHSNHR